MFPDANCSSVAIVSYTSTFAQHDIENCLRLYVIPHLACLGPSTPASVDPTLCPGCSPSGRPLCHPTVTATSPNPRELQSNVMDSYGHISDGHGM